MTEAERLAARLDASIYYDDQKAAALLRSQAVEIEALHANRHKREDVISDLKDAIESLEADALRMEWLEREAVITYGYDRTVKVAFPLNELGRTVVTLRHVVDEAMKQGEMK